VLFSLACHEEANIWRRGQDDRLYIDAAKTPQTAVVYQSDTPVSVHSIDVLAHCDNSAAKRVVKEGKLATFNAKKIEK